MIEENERAIHFCSARYAIWPTSLFMDENMEEIEEIDDKKELTCFNRNECNKNRCPVFLPREGDFGLDDVASKNANIEKMISAANDDSQNHVECCGIVTPTAIRGMLLTYASGLKRPVVVLERKPEKCMIYQNIPTCEPTKRCTGCENAKNLIRLESTAFYDRPMSACAWIRSEHGPGYCYSLDAAVTEWLLKKAEDKSIDNFTEKETAFSIPFKFKEEEFQIDATLRVLEGKNEKLLRILIYTCPHSGYRETAVLIECMGVYGVIIAGQTIFTGDDEEIITRNFNAQVSKELFGIPEWDNLKYREQKLLERVVARRKADQTKNKEDFLADVENMANRFLEDLELRYHRRVETRKRLLTSRAADEFHKGVQKLIVKYNGSENKTPRQGEPSTVENSKYEDTQKKFIAMLCRRALREGFREPGVEDYLLFNFNNAEIVITPEKFGKPIEKKTKKTCLDGVIATPGEVEMIECEPHVFSIKYTAMQKSDESIEIHIINAVDLSGLCKKDKNDENHHRVTTIQEILKSIFEQLERVAAQFCAEYHRKWNVTFTKSMRHELAQIYEGNQNSLTRYRNQFERDKAMVQDKVEQGLLCILSSEKNEREKEIRSAVQEGEKKLRMDHIDYLIRNFGGYMHASVMRVRSTRYMDLFPPPEPTWFYPYEAFLWKWRDIYGRISATRQFLFRLHSPDNRIHFDYTRPEISADVDQLEQVAYNLTNNAFKYACDGTVIDVDCRLCKKKEESLYRGCECCNCSASRYLLKVENFGFSLQEDEQEKIGEHGFRGSNAPTGTDGTGLGVWYCRGIAASHGGHLIRAYQPVSDYNFTSLLIYDQLPNEDEKEKMYQQARETWEIKRIETPADKRDSLKPFPFRDAADMGDKIMHELKKLKSNEIWNDRAENFDVKNSQLTCVFAGDSLLSGTAKYTFGICIPAKYKAEN